MIDPQMQDRMEVLAEKANEGLLTPEERAEYEAIMDVADRLAIAMLREKLARRRASE